ncbi:hypothetical protein [Aquimarina sp. Aq78]|uniref:hypothetical protein n=1 Tax=Aquimarina sp. Aq78 TaxID=1191889 RepID=UPI000D10230A|nr:hypothetical protein [Aquimarina sp. Aq78]
MKNYHLLLLTLLLSVACFANTGKDSLSVAKKKTASSVYKNPIAKGLDSLALQRLAAFKAKRIKDQAGSAYALRKYNTKQFRSFPELETPSTGAPAENFFQGLAEFTKDYIKKIYKPTPKTDSLVSKAKELFKEIEKQENFINIISGKELLQFPVGIKKQVSTNSSITIGIVKAKLHANYSEVDLFAKLTLGELSTELFFGANNVKLSHEGGIYGEAQLNLLGDFPIGQSGGQWIITFKGGLESDGSATKQTYITIDCTGKVKEIALEADVRIAKTVAIPLNDDGTKKFPGETKPQDGKNPAGNESYVGASFSFVATSLQDLLIELDLPKFELKPLPGWAFKMHDVVLDLSDTKNSPLVDFPKIYDEQQLIPSNQKELWRGFYGNEVSVTLPPEFQITKSEERISFGAKGLLIDNFGVSGNFFASNLFNINEGNAGKWQYSLDSVNVDIQVNHFIKADFSGELVLPISKSDSSSNGALGYKGLITADQHYSVRVEVTDDVDFNIFKSKAKLFPESYIKMEVENGKFYPEANLTGLMAFNKAQKDSLNAISSQDKDRDVGDIESLNFDGLSFQNFKIQTKTRPYLSIKYMGFKDTIALPKIAGFQLGFYDIKAKVYEDDRAEIGLNSYLNLDKSGIKGDVRLRIIGKLKEGDYLKWQFDKIEVDEVEVDVKRKNFEFYGKLAFFRDNPIYGKGLSGKLRLYAESLKIELEAKGIFGRQDDFRYWYVDAFGRPLSSKSDKALKIHDIGGGVYHHMRKAGMDERAESMSGIYYRPDIDTEFGFKAMAAFEVKKSATFTGLFAIEMSFNSKSAGGGISRLGFYGGAALMTSGGSSGGSSGGNAPFGTVDGMQKKLAEKEKSISNFHEMSIDKEGIKYFATEVFPNILTGKEQFAAQLAVDFDFRNDTYWGMFDVFLNLGQIRGAGEKNRLGYIEFYDAPDDWYIYIGTPTKRFGVAGIPIGPFDAAFDLYYMTGTILPDPALPKPEVIDILNLSGDELLFGRNFNSQLAQGTGYAFGAYVEIGKSFDWGIIYASVRAGVGFDFMIKDFGDAHCKGKAGPLGMDGWYATGQLYAFLQGEIGAQIKIFGFRKRIPILKAGVAVLAQGQLPNPWFVKGYAGIKVRILGLVTVQARLKVTIGEECEIVGKTGLQEVVIISDISPENNSDKVDVFEAVQVAFNVPIGEVVEISDDLGSKKYQVELKEITIKEGSTALAGEQVWNSNKDIMIFEPDDILPPEKKITATVKVQFNEYKGGQWVAVLENGQPIVEEKTVNFTTGKAPTKIPYKNIEYMYPIVDQRYVLPKESNTGYVQLERGQDYLFGTEGFKDELFFITENGKSMKTQFSYDTANNTLTFNLPKLPNKTGIVYKLITSKLGSGGNDGSTSEETYTNVSDDVSISQNTLTGNASTNASLTRLEFNFSTSRFNTFKEKIRAMDITDYYTFMDGSSNAAQMELRIARFEPFDVNEVLGTRYSLNKPLMSGVGMKSDYYYEKEIHPLLYQNYPLDTNIRVNRDENVLGTPPMKNIKPSLTYSEYVQNNPENTYLKERFPFRWNLAAAYKEDFVHLQYVIVNRYLNTNPIDTNAYQKYKYIIDGIFPYINVEKYQVEFQYALPNKTSGNKIKVDYKNYF